MTEPRGYLPMCRGCVWIGTAHDENCTLIPQPAPATPAETPRLKHWDGTESGTHTQPESATAEEEFERALETYHFPSTDWRRLISAHRRAIEAARSENAADHDWRRQMEAYGYDSVAKVSEIVAAEVTAAFERGCLVAKDSVPVQGWIAAARRAEAMEIRRNLIRCMISFEGRIDGIHVIDWLRERARAADIKE